MIKKQNKTKQGVSNATTHWEHSAPTPADPAGQGHIVQAGVSNQLPDEGGGQQEVCFCVCSSVWVLTIGASVLACTCV